MNLWCKCTGCKRMVRIEFLLATWPVLFGMDGPCPHHNNYADCKNCQESLQKRVPLLPIELKMIWAFPHKAENQPTANYEFWLVKDWLQLSIVCNRLGFHWMMTGNPTLCQEERIELLQGLNSFKPFHERLDSGLNEMAMILSGTSVALVEADEICIKTLSSTKVLNLKTNWKTICSTKRIWTGSAHGHGMITLVTMMSSRTVGKADRLECK